jgi:hypothetical protein
MKPSEFLSAYNNEGYVRSHPLRSEEYPDLATELEVPVSRIEEAYFQMGDYAWLAIENLGKGDQLSRFVLEARLVITLEYSGLRPILRMLPAMLVNL